MVPLNILKATFKAVKAELEAAGASTMDVPVSKEDYETLSQNKTGKRLKCTVMWDGWECDIEAAQASFNDEELNCTVVGWFVRPAMRHFHEFGTQQIAWHPFHMETALGDPNAFANFPIMLRRRMTLDVLEARAVLRRE